MVKLYPLIREELFSFFLSAIFKLISDVNLQGTRSKVFLYELLLNENISLNLKFYSFI